jgi:hypothetical protein
VVSQTAVGSRKAAIVSEFLSEVRWGDSNQQWQLEAGLLRAAEGVDLDDDESDEDEMDEVNEDEDEFDEGEDLEDEFEEEEEEDIEEDEEE